MARKTKTWWMAVTNAPTKERPNRTIAGHGKTEQDALVDLAAKCAALGVTSGEVRTIGPLGPEDRA